MLFRGKIFKAGLKTLSGNLRCFKDGLIWQEIVWKEGNDRNTSVILGGLFDKGFKKSKTKKWFRNKWLKYLR